MFQKTKKGVKCFRGILRVMKFKKELSVVKYAIAEQESQVKNLLHKIENYKT